MPHWCRPRHQCVFTSVAFLNGPSVSFYAARPRRGVRDAPPTACLRTPDASSSALLLRGGATARRDGSRGPIEPVSRGFDRVSSACVTAASHSLTMLHSRPSFQSQPFSSSGSRHHAGVCRPRFSRSSTAGRSASCSLPPGRIEVTESFQEVEDGIREIIPERRALIVDNIGLPARAYNQPFADGSTIGAKRHDTCLKGHSPPPNMSANCARRCQRPSRKTCFISRPPTL